MIIVPENMFLPETMKQSALLKRMVVGNNEKEYVPYGKNGTNKAVLNDKKRDQGMAEFKTRVHSASPNVFSARGKTPSEDSNEVAMKPRKNQLNERRSNEGDSDS